MCNCANLQMMLIIVLTQKIKNLFSEFAHLPICTSAYYFTISMRSTSKIKVDPGFMSGPIC